LQRKKKVTSVKQDLLNWLKADLVLHEATVNRGKALGNICHKKLEAGVTHHVIEVDNVKHIVKLVVHEEGSRSIHKAEVYHVGVAE
jgi:hypothetical protein